MIDNKDDPPSRHSRFLSLVLRHKPQEIGLALDAAGWAEVDDLLARLAQAGRALTRTQLEDLVAGNDKRRFAFSEDGRRIRANQGHTVEVDLALPPVAPPAVLYHGTARRSVESILRTGLDRRERHHVHLTEQVETATAVGARYGVPVILRIAAGAMAADGHVFRCTDNRVWLVDAVPANYLEVQP